MRSIFFTVGLVACICAAQASAQQRYSSGVNSPVPSGPPAVELTALPLAASPQAQRPAGALARIETLEQLLRLIPADYESVLAIHGKHPEPPPEPSGWKTQNGVTSYDPTFVKPKFDVGREIKAFPYLIERSQRDGWEPVPPIHERYAKRDVVLGALCMKDIKNKWAIPTGPDMQSLMLTAFRDDFDAEFLARLRRESAELRRMSGFDVFKYVKKAQAVPQPPDAPAGYGGPRDDEVRYIVVAASNVVVLCDDDKHAAAYAESLAKGDTIDRRGSVGMRSRRSSASVRSSSAAPRPTA